MSNSFPRGLAGFLGGVQRATEGIDHVIRERPSSPADGAPVPMERPSREERGLPVPTERPKTKAVERGLPVPMERPEPQPKQPREQTAQPYDLAESVVADDLSPEQRAFLNAIAGGESSGRYNVRYTPEGGAEFEGFGDHPRVYEQGPHGKSSAAGRYQFTAQTWDEMGAPSFEPAEQDRAAWKLATQRYKAKTGRDLAADLANSGLSDGVMDALSPTWAALQSNRDRHRATYQASLGQSGRGRWDGIRKSMTKEKEHG